LRNCSEGEALPSGNPLKRKNTQAHPFAIRFLSPADLDDRSTGGATCAVVESNSIEIIWLLADLGEVHDAVWLLRERRSPTGLYLIICIPFGNDMDFTAFRTTF